MWLAKMCLQQKFIKTLDDANPAIKGKTSSRQTDSRKLTADLLSRHPWRHHVAVRPSKHRRRIFRCSGDPLSIARVSLEYRSSIGGGLVRCIPTTIIYGSSAMATRVDCKNTITSGDPSIRESSRFHLTVKIPQIAPSTVMNKNHSGPRSCRALLPNRNGVTT